VKLFKFMAKLILLPVILIIIVIQWIGIFLNGITEAILGILSFLFFFTGMASLIFGLAPGAKALQVIAAAFVFFLIPRFGDWLIERIIFLRCVLGDFIRS